MMTIMEYAIEDIDLKIRLSRSAEGADHKSQTVIETSKCLTKEQCDELFVAVMLMSVSGKTIKEMIDNKEISYKDLYLINGDKKVEKESLEGV